MQGALQFVSSVTMEMYKLESLEHARKASVLFWRGAAAQHVLEGIPVATPLHQHQEWHVRLGGRCKGCQLTVTVCMCVCAHV